jgi:serine/threonine protein phosphatase PrpC
MNPTVALQCPRCGRGVDPADRFCEACGSPLHDEAPRDAVGGRELDLQRAAAVSDRGLVHRRNEDAFYLAVTEHAASGPVVVAVVCDGVSTSVASDVAARVAANTAGAVLRDGLSTHDHHATMREAISAASRAVLAIPWTASRDLSAPSCTLAAALVTDSAVTIGSVGDSRAYWVDGSGATRLTRDDSWAEEQIAAGYLSESEATRDPRAHVITAWLGDDAPDDPVEVLTFHAARPGHLVLCSDGLWNYTPEPADLAALIPTTGDGSATPLDVARRLVEHALGAGGRDNITVAVVAIEGASTYHEEHA